MAPMIFVKEIYRRCFEISLASVGTSGGDPSRPYTRRRRVGTQLVEPKEEGECGSKAGGIQGL